MKNKKKEKKAAFSKNFNTFGKQPFIGIYNG